MKYLPTICLIIYLLLSGCDTDKYFSYDYEAEALLKAANISGTITDIFTGQPVNNAVISFEGQQTATNQLGNYQITYFLSDDASQGKMIPITIAASNYISFDLERQMFPETIRLDFELEYGAPIIQETSLVFVGDQPVCQAIVMDYQGADDITSVTAQFRYTDSLNFVALTVDTLLAPVKTPSLNIRYFQVNPRDSLNGFALNRAYTLTAIDKDGFSDVEHHRFLLFDPDTLLFDPFNP